MLVALFFFFLQLKRFFSTCMVVLVDPVSWVKGLQGVIFVVAVHLEYFVVIDGLPYYLMCLSRAGVALPH